MSLNRMVFLAAALLLAAVFTSCSSDKATKDQSQDQRADVTPAVAADTGAVAQMQATLTEAITRWRNRDKSALYEMEFPYLKARTTYDQYLKLKRIAAANADSVVALNIKNADLMGDSAWVDVEVVIVTSRGDTNRLMDRYPMYHFDGRWIRPTLSGWDAQMQFDQLKRQADSSAKAEQNENW